MDVQQGLPKPPSLGKPSLFGLYKPNPGGGGWTRTSDKGLMSSWLWGSLLVVIGRLRPVFGGNKPKSAMSSYRRPGAVRREQREMDVKMDVWREHRASCLYPFVNCRPANSPSVWAPYWRPRFGGLASVPGCSSVCQVQGDTDLGSSFHSFPDGYWAVASRGGDMRDWPKIPRAWWPKIAQAHALQCWRV
jgi:hypothetical protein